LEVFEEGGRGGGAGTLRGASLEGLKRKERFSFSDKVQNCPSTAPT